jgi:hypothetical protein
MEDAREISAATEQLRHIDHGYASTSHSSQGATLDRAIINIDTTRSVQLVNRKQFYVSISRARQAAAIYTDDRARLLQTVSRNREKSTALEALQSKLSPEFNSVSDRVLHGVNRVQERGGDEKLAAALAPLAHAPTGFAGRPRSLRHKCSAAAIASRN